MPPGFCITTAAYQQVAGDAVHIDFQDADSLAERARAAILAPTMQFSRGSRAAEATVTRTVSRVRRRSRLRAAAVRFALGRVRELVGMRETHKDYLVRVLAHVREQLRAVGAELADRGLLAEAEDVFFLDLVMEMGGSNSHGAVVAREYGIPAIRRVPDATLRIATGQRITVVGATGRVEPH